MRTHLLFSLWQNYLLLPLMCGGESPITSAAYPLLSEEAAAVEAITHGKSSTRDRCPSQLKGHWGSSHYTLLMDFPQSLTATGPDLLWYLSSPDHSSPFPLALIQPKLSLSPPFFPLKHCSLSNGIIVPISQGSFMNEINMLTLSTMPSVYILFKCSL